MRILIDECLPRRLKQHLPGHVVHTVQEMGWAGVSNGALLDLAQAQFDVFVTMDQSLQYQQNLRGRTIAVIVLKASTNRYASLAPLMPAVESALRTVQSGQVTHIA